MNSCEGGWRVKLRKGLRAAEGKRGVHTNEGYVTGTSFPPPHADPRKGEGGQNFGGKESTHPPSYIPPPQL